MNQSMNADHLRAPSPTWSGPVSRAEALRQAGDGDGGRGGGGGGGGGVGVRFAEVSPNAVPANAKKAVQNCSIMACEGGHVCTSQKHELHGIECHVAWETHLSRLGAVLDEDREVADLMRKLMHQHL